MLLEPSVCLNRGSVGSKAKSADVKRDLKRASCRLGWNALPADHTLAVESDWLVLQHMTSLLW